MPNNAPRRVRLIKPKALLIITGNAWQFKPRHNTSTQDNKSSRMIVTDTLTMMKGHTIITLTLPFLSHLITRRLKNPPIYTNYSEKQSPGITRIAYVKIVSDKWKDIIQRCQTIYAACTDFKDVVHYCLVAIISGRKTAKWKFWQGTNVPSLSSCVPKK